MRTAAGSGVPCEVAPGRRIRHRARRLSRRVAWMARRTMGALVLGRQNSALGSAVRRYHSFSIGRWRCRPCIRKRILRALWQ